MASNDAAAAAAARDVRASLPLEIALYFHGVYWPVYALLVLALIVYKGRSRRLAALASSARAAGERRPSQRPPPPPPPHARL